MVQFTEGAAFAADQALVFVGAVLEPNDRTG
jgi:hypothetical protein